MSWTKWNLDLLGIGALTEERDRLKADAKLLQISRDGYAAMRNEAANRARAEAARANRLEEYLDQLREDNLANIAASRSNRERMEGAEDKAERLRAENEKLMGERDNLRFQLAAYRRSFGVIVEAVQDLDKEPTPASGPR